MTSDAFEQKEIKIEGIVVKALDYQENKRIFTLFTPDGLMDCIIGLHKSQPQKRLLSSFLSRGEYCFSQTPYRLKKIKDGSVLSTYLHYNHSYEHLEAASLLIKGITQSQMEEKSAPLLYALVCLYLEKLPEMKDPYLLTSSFLLKLLMHEGLMVFRPSCDCLEGFAATHFNGESLKCKKCCPSPHVLFSLEETETLMILAHAKQFSLIKFLKVSKEFHGKIKSLFEACAV